ncbi:MAG: hypothetical protein ACPGR7_10585 [Flavobacteriaceae bacterium]
MYKIQKHDGKYCLLKKEKAWVFVNADGAVVSKDSHAKKSKNLASMYAFMDDLL